MQVVKEVRYLGVMMKSRHELFAKQKRQILEKAKSMSKMSFSVIEKSCLNVIIEKTHWKSVALPRVLFVMGALDWRNKLQSQENVTMRRIQTTL